MKIVTVPSLKDNRRGVVIVFRKTEDIRKFSGILKNVKDEDIKKALEEIERGAYIS